MTDPLNRFWDEATNIRLASEEHVIIRKNIGVFMKANPHVPEAVLEAEGELEPELKKFFELASKMSLLESEHEDIRIGLRGFIAKHPVIRTSLRRLHRRMKSRFGVHDGSAEKSLHGAEKTAVRKRLVQYMQENPQDVQNVSELLDVRMGTFEWVETIIRGVIPRTMIVACLFLLIGTGAAYAAEQAVPGNFLYAVKVKVVEPIRGKLNVDAKQKAEWEGVRAMRRLEETEQLVARGSLDESTWAALHSDFVEQYASAEAHIVALAEQGDMNAAADVQEHLDAKLQAHRSIIGAIGFETSSSEQTKDILDDVDIAQKKIGRNSLADFSLSSGGQLSEHSQKDADITIKGAHVAVGAAKVTTRADMETDVSTALLRQADDSIVNATEKYQQGKFEDASDLARSAMRYSEEAKLLRKLPEHISSGFLKREQKSLASVAASSSADSAATSTTSSKTSSKETSQASSMNTAASSVQAASSVRQNSSVGAQASSSVTIVIPDIDLEKDLQDEL